ncbi:MAG: glycine cleavage system protein [Tardiphaga sp.]|nr:glycine cleavage system protein [Tardiphaga sp.]
MGLRLILRDDLPRLMGPVMVVFDDSTALKMTPLHGLNLARGGKMVPFAGYEMAVQFAPGVLKEHLHTRSKAGLFDVSHMGQITLTPKSGRVEDAARALERLVPQDIVALAPGRQRYAQFTNDSGGIRDDLMISNLGDHLFLVVNAACKTEDEAHLRAHLSEVCEIAVLDRALIALQGPAAADALSSFCQSAGEMIFMEAGPRDVMGIPCLVSRSGYTGEDGYEISVPADRAEALATALLDHPEVMPIGLGARDSLRLEAGLCLYGHDIDMTTSPVEAGLTWSIQKSRRNGGARAGGFPGAATILAQIDGAPLRRRVGLQPEGRAPVREGARLFATADAAAPIGAVTSGGFGPSAEAPVAMGYVPSEFAAGATIFAELRGQRLPMRVTALPFIPHSYKR